MLPWEKQPMHASLFFSVSKGTDQLSFTCKRLLNCWRKMQIYGWELGWLPRRFAQFLGIAADCCLDFHKSWAEQPVSGEICANPAGRVGWQDCVILEPSRLLERIARFLEGRLVSL